MEYTPGGSDIFCEIVLNDFLERIIERNREERKLKNKPRMILIVFLIVEI